MTAIFPATWIPAFAGMTEGGPDVSTGLSLLPCEPPWANLWYNRLSRRQGSVPWSEPGACIPAHAGIARDPFYQILHAPGAPHTALDSCVRRNDGGELDQGKECRHTKLPTMFVELAPKYPYTAGGRRQQHKAPSPGQSPLVRARGRQGHCIPAHAGIQFIVAVID